MASQSVDVASSHCAPVENWDYNLTTTAIIPSFFLTVFVLDTPTAHSSQSKSVNSNLLIITYREFEDHSKVHLFMT